MLMLVMIVVRSYEQHGAVGCGVRSGAVVLTGCGQRARVSRQLCGCCCLNH